MIYVYSDTIDIFFNPYGRHFKSPITISLPEKYTKIDKIEFSDVNGNGGKSIVFIKIGTETKYYFLELNDGIKPYLLKTFDNNKGMLINIKYKSSVSFYLEDKSNGIVWKSNVPFPIYLVSEIEKIDLTTEFRLNTKYRYKHGYYDNEKRKFNGFGYIDKIETRSLKNQNKSYVYKKYWYYTGRFKENYCDEFNFKDEQSYKMSDNFFDIFKKEFIIKAQNALKGKIIREEIYDSLDESDICKAEEYNYTVIQLSGLDLKTNICFFASEREHITYNYEKNIKDPCVKHNFILDFDEYGNILEKCTIFYPRRIEGELEQNKLVCQIEVFNYINKKEEEMPFGVLKEYKKFSINKLILENDYFSFMELKEQINRALKYTIDFGVEFDNINLQSKLEKWERYFYWNSEQTEELPFGEVSKNILLHHDEKAIFSKKLADDIFEGFVSEEMLKNDCFYQLNENYWWKFSPIIYYYSQKEFFLKHKVYKQCFDKKFETIIKYDKYCLLPVEGIKIIDNKNSLSVTAEVDYTSINYSSIKDENDNITNFVYDCFGKVCVKTVYGFEGNKHYGNDSIDKYKIRQDENFESIIKNPELYIQGMSSYYFYDVNAYKERKQPISCIEILRQNFFSDNKVPEIEFNIEFYNGFGKTLEKKVKLSENWLVEYRKVYNDNNFEIEAYKSYFAENCKYEINLKNSFPTYIKYDALNRIISQEKPYYQIENGKTPYVFSKIVYEPWRERFYDENDLIIDSDYYNEFLNCYPQNPKDENYDTKDALDKAKKMYDTPIIKIFDNRHYKIKEISNRENNNSYFNFNNQGKILTISQEKLKQQGMFNCKYIYNMLDKPVYIVLSDSGTKITLDDIFDNEIHYLDSNKNHKRLFYDNINRHISTYVDNIGITEKIIYGESAHEGKKFNLNNQVYKRFSQLGTEGYEQYDIQKNVLTKTTTFCENYKTNIDWSNEENVCLKNETFTERFKYNSLSKKVYYSSSQNNSYKYCYNSLGLLKNIFQIFDASKEICLTGLEYASNKKIKNIYHNNGLKINYIYNDVSFNLEYIKVFNKCNKLIQSFKYIFDPVGNITRIRSEIDKEIYNKGQIVKGIFDYSYNETYSLIEATGKELPKDKDRSDYESLENYKEIYSYDESRNLIKIKHSSLSSNWVSDMGVDSISNRLIKLNDISFSYDKNGNMTSLCGIKNMNWNFENRLSSVDLIVRENEASDSEYYIYNSEGTRVRKVTEKKTGFGKEITEKIYFEGYEIKRIYQSDIILERKCMHFNYNNLPLITSYYWSKDNYKRETDDINVTKNHYYCVNTNCSISVETDDEGRIISYEEYYPYGGTAFENVKIENIPKKEYRYCGKEKDLSGLYYFKNRYYCPYIGRMISSDDIKYLDEKDVFSINSFVYCKNNPMRYMDTDGNCPYSGPFSSADEAAMDFGIKQYGVTESGHKEIASRIVYTFQDEETVFSYMSYTMGEEHEIDIDTLPPVPQGLTQEAVVHTHPNSFMFSQADKKYAKDENTTIYVVTPQNNQGEHYVRKFVPPNVLGKKRGADTLIGTFK